MAHRELTRRQKAFALLPVLVVSGAWTASLNGFGLASAVGDKDRGHLPDGTQVPGKAIEAPANVAVPGSIGPGVPAGDANSVVANASTSGIPSAALSAYQRAAQIIDSADASCHVPWELIAAIGRVESDHGRYGGNVLGADGVSKPGIFGPRLDGKNGTEAIADTDGGQLDQDTTSDRAVGPMQFIPSTWQVVKVDADGDGQRNPQDIDDASLATAVYLCSGSEDLGGATGQRSAIYRYNHSQAYVDLVMRIMSAYEAGDYTAVPNGTIGGGTFAYRAGVPASGPTPRAVIRKHRATTSALPHSVSAPTSAAAAAAGSSGGSGSGGSHAGPSKPTAPVKTPSHSAASNPVQAASSAAASAAAPVTSAAAQVLSKAQATVQCAVVNPVNLATCIAQVTGATQSQADAIIAKLK